MNKIIKKRTSYNISDFVLRKFNEISSNKAINKSKLIENLINKWIKEQEDVTNERS